MERAAYFRTRARAALGNRIFGGVWLMAIVAFLIQSGITGAVSFTGVGIFIVSGPLEFGIAKIMIGLTRGRGAVDLADMIKGFTDDFGGTLLIFLMRAIFVMLWSLLLFVPGIIKAYSYSMAFYIKVDNPDYDWKQCLSESKRIMDGNKWRLFCLDMSFIGWIIVGALCFGVGTLFVNAYISAARAAFYDSIKAV